MIDIIVILPGESKYEIKFCRQATNLRVMVDFTQKMYIFETAIFNTFAFGAPFSPKKVVGSLKSIYF